MDLIIISLKINLFSPWYSWKIAELALNNNHSLTSIWRLPTFFIQDNSIPSHNIHLYISSRSNYKKLVTISMMVWYLDLMQSLPITTKDVHFNQAYVKVYSIQHYMIEICQWLEAGQWFCPSNKTDCHNILEILHKVMLKCQYT